MKLKAYSTAPMDRATIITSILLDQNLARQIQEDPSSIPSPWRDLVVDTNSKVARRKDGDVPCLISHLDTYGGIELRAEMKFGRWYITRIAFNPSKLLYGHNGRILDEEGLLLALSILKALVSRVLENVADAIHVIPGTHSDSIAWWSSVEIPFQQPDLDGKMLPTLGNIRHPDIRRLPLRCHGESIKLESSDKNFSINIYRKDLELRKKVRGHNISNAGHIVRVEVALKGMKLLEYFSGNAQFVEIAGKLRLVSFRPADLIQTHRNIVGQLQGCYAPPNPGKDAKDKVGRIVGWYSRCSGVPIEDGLAFCADRFQLNVQSVCRNRKAAHEEAALHSEYNFAQLFSEYAWQHQAVIEVPDLEAMTQARHRGIQIDPLIATAYGSLPAESYQTLS